jgi:hypothetical protein
MEPFFDGGLFELLLFAAFAVCMNFIFLKRYLLVLFSLSVMASPVALFFVRRSELYYWLVALCVLNSCLLVALLWKEKQAHPQQPLFDTSRLKETSLKIRDRFLRFVKRVS